MLPPYISFVLLFIISVSVNLISCQKVENDGVEGVEEKFITPCSTPNGKNGLCVEIQKCPIFMRALAERNNSTFPFIQASRCGPSNEDPLKPKVCCGEDVNYSLPGQNHQQQPQEPEHIIVNPITTPLPQHLKDPLPEICGTQRVIINNRIVGGQEASIGEFPWMARIVHRNAYNHTNLGCSAFLIHRKFAMTAAHCIRGVGVQTLGGVVGLILGSHDSTNQAACMRSERGDVCAPAPKFVATLTPIVHSDYELRDHTNDIALIPLKDKISFSDYIKAICLPKVESNIPEFMISGWGKTESDTGSSVKLKVTLPRVDRERCDLKYKTVGKHIIDMQLCAGGLDGKDSCAGDSGGPLMAFNVQEQKWYAEGIVSYGFGCGREDWPGVYTNTPRYYPWIVDVIRKHKS